MVVSEEQIERHAEKTMDLLDDLFMRGQIDETQYDARITALEAWCGKQYAILALLKPKAGPFAGIIYWDEFAPAE